MSSEDQGPVENPKAPAVSGAILIELENVAANGRNAMFDVLKSMLADKDVDLKRHVFVKHCLEHPLDVCLSHLLEALDKGRFSADKLATEVRDALRLSIENGDGSHNTVLPLLLDTAKKANFAVGALTCMPKKGAVELLPKLGADKAAITVSSAPATRPDAWRSLARSVGAQPRDCIAITTSSAACRAAVMAGTRVAVLPDSFTDFQDFGGADRVLDTLDAEAAGTLFELLPEA